MRDTFEEQEEAAVRIDKTDDDEDGPVEMPDGTLRCRLHGLEICGSCCCDYTFMRDVLEEQEEEEAAKRMQESDKADDDEDGAVEMPDGTLRCRQHYLEICGICCRDYTFMRDHLEEQEEAAKEDWAPYEEEQTKTKLVLCNVCSKECQKKCSVCKSVFCECDFLPPLVATEHLLPRPDCGPEHQRQVREEQD